MVADVAKHLPLVSIGIPTFNRVEPLKRAIQSASEQTYAQLEIIIADNCSTDTTQLLCTQLAEQDRRIRYIRHPHNRGAIANFRSVLDAATGDYFMWLGDDDWLELNYVEQCARALAENADYALVAGQVQYALEDGQVSDRIALAIAQESRQQRVLHYYATVGDNGIFYGLMRRSVVSGLTFQRIMGWDWLLLAAIAFQGKLGSVDSTHITRSYTCVDNPVLGYQRIAQRENLSEFHGCYPHLSIALSAFTDIAYLSPAYGDLAPEERVALAQQVQGLLCQRHRIQLGQPLLDFLNAVDWVAKRPNDSEAIAHFEQQQAAVEAQGLQDTAQQLRALYTGKVSPYAEQPGDRHDALAAPKIAIDGVFFQRYQTGIARVWQSLLKEWSQTELAQHLLVLDRGGTAPRIANLAYRILPAHHYTDLAGDRALLQAICDSEGIDLFVSTYYTSPTVTPTAFMAYDMIPEVVGADMREPMWFEKHQAIQHASAYLAISENTAVDLARYFPAIEREAVRVTHCGIDASFQPSTPEAIAQFKAQYGIDRPYFLLSGPGIGYKNAELFFQALPQLASAAGFAIVCTGTHGFLDPALQELVPGSFIYALQLDDSSLRHAYSGAIALVYPSRYEGFGLPVLEAMACGCPVITCPNASIPEVAGEAAIYVGDRDIPAMAEALCEVQKPAVRKRLIRQGLERAQQFSWSKMAAQVAETLLETTLLDLNLQATNAIACPDWSQPEAELAADVHGLMQRLAAQAGDRPVTLLLANCQLEPETANLLLTGIVMEALWSEDFAAADGLAVSVVNPLSNVQLPVLHKRLAGRLALEREDGAAIAQFGLAELPVIEEMAALFAEPGA